MSDERAEADRLCDELLACVKLGPTSVPNAFAPGKVRGIIAALYAAPIGIEAHRSLPEIEASFERWFSPGKWKGDDDGQFAKRDLYRIIAGLQATIDVWFATRPQSSDPT